MRTPVDDSREGFKLVALQEKLTHNQQKRKKRGLFMSMVAAFLFISLLFPGFLTPSNEVRHEKLHKPAVHHMRKHHHKKEHVKSHVGSAKGNRVQPAIVSTRAPVLPIPTRTQVVRTKTGPKVVKIRPVIKISTPVPTKTVPTSTTVAPTATPDNTLLGPTVQKVCDLVKGLNVC